MITDVLLAPPVAEDLWGDAMRAKRKITHHRIVADLGERVRHVRESQGMSQYQLANKSHLSLNYIGKIERGEVAIGVDTLAGLASGLQVSASDLLQGMVKTEPSESVNEKLIKMVQALTQRNDPIATQALLVIVSRLDTSVRRKSLKIQR